MTVATFRDMVQILESAFSLEEEKVRGDRRGLFTRR